MLKGNNGIQASGEMNLVAQGIMPRVVLFISEEEALRREFDRLKRLVCADRQARLGRFRFFADAQRSLAGDLMARALICERTGLKNTELIFGAGEYGKPYLVNDGNVHFNVSHSGGYVVCVVDDSPVGIDVELVRSANMGIAGRFFAPDETAYITHSEEGRDTRFCQIWTMKESYIKWEGMGLSESLSSFSTLNRQEGIFYHRVFRNRDVACYACTEKTSLPVCEIMGREEFLSLVETNL